MAAELTPASRWLLIVRERADEIRKNAEGLRKFEGMEQEARARELGAQYMIETAQSLVMDERYADDLAAVVDQSQRIADLRAALATQQATQGAEPVATLHDDGYYTFKRGKEPHGARYAGWRLDVYTSPPPTAEVELLSQMRAYVNLIKGAAMQGPSFFTEERCRNMFEECVRLNGAYLALTTTALQSDQAQAGKGE